VVGRRNVFLHLVELVRQYDGVGISIVVAATPLSNRISMGCATGPEIMGNHYQNLRGHPYERDPDQSDPT
jgi:hypothetical protein